MKKILVLCIIVWAVPLAFGAPVPATPVAPAGLSMFTDRSDDNPLDQGGTDTLSATVISGCPYNDSGNYDGDEDVAGSPYSDVFYQYTPAVSGWHQFRVRNASGVGSNGAIRITTGFFVGTLVVSNTNSVAGDCEGLTSQLTYARANLTAGTTYYIQVGQASSTVESSGAYEFNMTCIQCPPPEWEGPSHNTCATAQPLACGDSLFADSASQEIGLTPDWYSLNVTQNSNVTIFVGSREWGHCTTGLYPGGSTIDGRFTLYAPNCGDSIGFGDDEGCSLDAKVTFTLAAGAYYIKVWNKGTVTTSVRDYIITVSCVGALDCNTFLPCGTPAETEPNNDCTVEPNFLEMTCGSGVASYYGTLCPASDVDYFHVSPVAPGNILTIRIYDGDNCDVFPAVAARIKTAGLTACGSPSANGYTSFTLGTDCVPYGGGYFAVVNSGNSELKYRVELTCTPVPPPACPDVTLPKQFCAGPCVGPIIDNSTVAYFMDVPLNEIIDDLNLRVNITHAWDSDIQMYLITPWEDTLEITTGNGGSGDNYQITLFDDEAACSIADPACATPPFNGSYRPEEPLALADGNTAAGTYTLLITDNHTGSSGYVNCWCLEFESHVPCSPTSVVNFERYPVPQYACADLCAGVSTLVRICQAGVPFDPALPPIVMVLPGCDPATTNCDFVCDPAQFAYDPALWAINPANGCWENIVTGTTGGCVCVSLEGFLNVELNSFTATAGDRRVTLDWVTKSEPDNDYFEIERDHVKIDEIDGKGSTTSGATYTWTDYGLTNGTTYTYSLLSVDINGGRALMGNMKATPTSTVVITDYALYQNYPNPFNPTTSITFDLLEAGFVNLKVYNVMGQEVAALVQRTLPMGRHVVSFDAASLPSGIYIYQLSANSFTATQKMILMK